MGHPSRGYFTPFTISDGSVLVRDEIEEYLNILVIDDEETVCAALKVVFKCVGHAVDAVYDGEQALSRLRELPHHYQILVMDHFMKKISGLEFMVNLPVNTFKGKIIVLSGYLTPELEAKYRALGADRIMRKPFDADELRKAIEELSPKPGQQQNKS